MGSILFAPCSGRQVTQIFPSNVENYMQHLKNSVDLRQGETTRFTNIITSIFNVVIETFKSYNKLEPIPPTNQESIKETLHDILYSKAIISPYCIANFIRQENTTFEIFKYADEITFYAGFCSGETEHASRTHSQSALTIKKIFALPQGSGLMLVKLGQKYVKMLEGHFDKGEFSQGYIITDSFLYIGGYSKTGYAGAGKLFYSDGQIFLGNFVNGKLNGDNCTIYKPGECYYTGRCVNSSFEGKGELKYESEHSKCVRYSGEFKCDLPDGHGIMEYKNGMKYEGQWEGGKFNGEGKLYGGDEEYVGEFRNGMRNGKGVFLKANILRESFKEKYDGEWKDDEKHGRGQISFIDEKGKQCNKVGFWKYNKLEKYID